MAATETDQAQNWLAKQDLDKIGAENLNPLTEEASFYLHFLWLLSRPLTLGYFSSSYN